MLLPDMQSYPMAHSHSGASRVWYAAPQWHAGTDDTGEIGATPDLSGSRRSLKPTWRVRRAFFDCIRHDSPQNFFANFVTATAPIPAAAKAASAPSRARRREFLRRFTISDSTLQPAVAR